MSPYQSAKDLNFLLKLRVGNTSLKVKQCLTGALRGRREVKRKPGQPGAAREVAQGRVSPYRQNSSPPPDTENDLLGMKSVGTVAEGETRPPAKQHEVHGRGEAQMIKKHIS
ncbi:hypothetical protein E2C01_061615 [Portunus trituberculatus]|uniref:Uncharacterized protein n=1 Tax=Portunus trituberculatus TaxID=210409 RepID=A0A5B7H5Q5_PORTR|nr:hypothetical protein [Portunus trituberculatus]